METNFLFIFVAQIYDKLRVHLLLFVSKHVVSNNAGCTYLFMKICMSNNNTISLIHMFLLASCVDGPQRGAGTHPSFLFPACWWLWFCCSGRIAAGFHLSIETSHLVNSSICIESWQMYKEFNFFYGVWHLNSYYLLRADMYLQGANHWQQTQQNESINLQLKLCCHTESECMSSWWSLLWSVSLQKTRNVLVSSYWKWWLLENLLSCNYTQVVQLL